MKGKRSKVAIVGAGDVGTSYAYALMMAGTVRDIDLIDLDERKARGEAMDLNHGAAFTQAVRVEAANYSGCKDADVVVVTAGARQGEDETRLDLAAKNVKIFKDIIPQITEHTRDAVIVIVTNPVDVLTYAALAISGLPKNQVIGSGTVLDSSRFRYLIGEHCGVDARNVHAYIVGEHGDSELPVWSQATIGGVPIARYCPTCGKGCDYRRELGTLFEEVKNAAYEIIECKGATYYAIGLALVRITQAVVRDENAVLPVSSYIDDYHGVGDVCLSVPAVVNAGGVKNALNLELADDEKDKLVASAAQIRKVIDAAGL